MIWLQSTIQNPDPSRRFVDWKKTTIESKVVENKKHVVLFSNPTRKSVYFSFSYYNLKQKQSWRPFSPKLHNPTHHWLVQLGSGQRDGQGPLTAYDRSKSANPVLQGKPPWGGSLLPKKLQKTTSLTSALPFKNSITTQKFRLISMPRNKNTKKTKASCHPWFLVKRPHQSEAETIWFGAPLKGQLWNPKRNFKHVSCH